MLLKIFFFISTSNFDFYCDDFCSSFTFFFFRFRFFFVENVVFFVKNLLNVRNDIKINENINYETIITYTKKFLLCVNRSTIREIFDS